MRKQRFRIIAVFVFVLLFVSSFSKNLYAGENWEFELAPYVWMVSMNGDITVKGQTSEVDASFSDFLEDLVFAAEVHFEATRKKDRKYGFWFDGTYMKLDSDAEIGPINLDVENQTAIIEGPYGAAEILGLNPSTLRSRTRKLGIKRPRVHN